MSRDLPNNRTLRWVCVFAALSGLMAAGMLPLDSKAIPLLNLGPSSALAPFLAFVDQVWPLLTLSFALLVGGGSWIFAREGVTRRLGLWFALSPLVASSMASVLKAWVMRPRPQAAIHGLDGIDPIVALADLKSFPSGHVTSATAFALCVFLWARPRWLKAAILCTIPVMMWNRVALAVHFPSDAWGGVAVGALAVAGVALALRPFDPKVAPWGRALALSALVLLVTAVLGRAPIPTDPVTLEAYDGLRCIPQWQRTIFEPICGPVLELAWAASPLDFLKQIAPWIFFGLAFLWIVVPAYQRKRLLVLLVGIFALWGTLLSTGRLPPDRFAQDSLSGVFVDLHVHGSDPVDGAKDLDFILDRKAGRHVDLVAITNHDAMPPTPRALAGLEWSGYRHAEQIYLHLLVFGGEGALAEVLKVVVPPLIPGGTAGRDLGIEAVRRAKSRGAVVIVAHWWRTLARMKRDGTQLHLPSPKELVVAGVDGFEVANRSVEMDSEGRKHVEAIDALCREHGLLRIATSDDHGIPAGSPVISFLPGDFPSDPAALQAAVFEHLKARRVVRPVVFSRSKGLARVPVFLGGPKIIAHYLQGLTMPARLSWLVWIAWATWWLGLARPLPASAREAASQSGGEGGS